MARRDRLMIDIEDIEVDEMIISPKFETVKWVRSFFFNLNGDAMITYEDGDNECIKGGEKIEIWDL